MLHFHKYEEVSRQFMEQEKYKPVLFGAIPIGSPEPVTVVTYKCIKCPKHKQVTLSGWVK